MNVRFDWNEWYFILTSAIALASFIPIRAYFPRVVVILIWICNAGLVASTDYFLIATPFRLYYFGDNPSYELSGSLFHLFMYPCASLLFLYGYDRWRLRGWRLAGYIAAWTGVAVAFEWLSVVNGALTYTGWKLRYSVPVYPAAASGLILLYRFIASRLATLQKMRQTAR
ncbi:hypothetical protein I8J29_11385 [Paenibacillus sp. MWE-103]|uniref:Uncharacterized protein n=1 Tax=Paenibacillus artemisiicola TaxID=1172618 RepID=A0ABS3W955_9BACL|nr:CBO0543 family protein [Paenibacillus artemisiicola]MBO7744803.1 hypothetical protein [Paenibacillus artemisiicola]